MPILGRRHPELVEIAGPLPPAWLRARTWNWGMGLNPGNFWVNSWNPIDSDMVPPGRLGKNPKGARNVSGNDVQRIQPRDFWVPYFQTPDKPQWALVQLGGPLFNESMVFEWAGMFTAFLAVLLKNSYPIAKGLQDKGAITPFTGRMRKSTAHVRSHRFQAYSATKRPHSGWWSLQTLSFLIGIPPFSRPCSHDCW